MQMSVFVTAGVCLNTLDTNTAVRSCGFSFSANLIMLTTDKTMGFPCDILVYDVRDGSQMSQFCFFTFSTFNSFILLQGMLPSKIYFWVELFQDGRWSVACSFIAAF